jgi:hypothetical protein
VRADCEGLEALDLKETDSAAEVDKGSTNEEVWEEWPSSSPRRGS